MRKRAFTLIELLVVIAIIAMLLAVVVPAIRKTKEVARRVLCSSNMRQTLIGLRSYAETHDGRLVPMADMGSPGADLITGANVVYSDNRGTTPWANFQPWEGVIGHATEDKGVVQIPKSKAYHLATLLDLDMLSTPEVFYCPAQPMVNPMFNMPYRYEAYTNKGGYEWGTFCPQTNPVNVYTGSYVRYSYNYWVHEKIRLNELHGSKILLVDNLQDWNAIPHRKAGATSSPQGISVGYVDGHVSFCINDELFKKTAVFNGVTLWPGCDTERTDDGPGNITASFKAILMAISQSGK